MRSVNRSRSVLAAAVALLAACGNYSTEDLRFLAALPTRPDLHVAPPASASAAAASLDASLAPSCANGTADVWLWAKPTSDGLNAGVDFVLSLVDVVRKLPPTAREANARRWGPFADDHHPGREIQVVMTRWFPDGNDAHPVHGYRFEARITGSGAAFDPVIVGSFDGASARHGRGQVSLDFQAMWTLGINDATTPHGRMDIGYDRVSEPVTVDLTLSQQGFGVEQFGYGYAGYSDGTGRFDYRIRNTSTNDVLTVTTGFDAAGAGRAAVAVVLGAGGTGAYSQCWSPAACLTYVRDPSNFSCPAHVSCSLGAYPADCAPVPYVGPFPVP
jgi:hypothetical protein